MLGSAVVLVDGGAVAVAVVNHRISPILVVAVHLVRIIVTVELLVMVVLVDMMIGMPRLILTGMAILAMDM